MGRSDGGGQLTVAFLYFYSEIQGKQMESYLENCILLGKKITITIILNNK